MKKVLLLATYDSFLRTGLVVAEAIENAQIDIRIRTTASNQLSKEQLNSILGEKDYNCSYFFMGEYKKIDYNEYDIIILSAGNEFIKAFFTFYLQNTLINRDKIVTVSLFPGVIFGDVDSIASRMNVDILLCNNKIDYEIAKSIKETYNLDTHLLLYGFPIIKKIESLKKERVNTYFFEQVKIPETYSDRFYLLSKLVEYASQNPDETVYIKPRVALNEKTVHINRYPMEKLLEEYAKNNILPKNLFFTYQSIEACFTDMKLGITLSSTVAVEAIYNALPMAIISDFGLRNDFANKDFLGSGCLVSFDNLGKQELKVNSDWYDSMIAFPKKRDIEFNRFLVDITHDNKRRVNHIGTASIDLVSNKQNQYISKNKKRILKAIKNPQYAFSVLWNFFKNYKVKK